MDERSDNILKSLSIVEDDQVTYNLYYIVSNHFDKMDEMVFYELFLKLSKDINRTNEIIKFIKNYYYLVPIGILQEVLIEVMQLEPVDVAQLLTEIYKKLNPNLLKFILLCLTVNTSGNCDFYIGYILRNIYNTLKQDYTRFIIKK